MNLLRLIKKHPVRSLSVIGGTVTAVTAYLSSKGWIGEAEIAFIGTLQTVIAGAFAKQASNIAANKAKPL